MARIGFIGLGNMGLPMAGNLVKAGHDVSGFDIIPANLQAAASHGIMTEASLEAVSSSRDVVITMLPSGKETLQVYANSGALSSADPGTVFIDCSTIDVASARKAHELAATAGQKSLDSPVSGGVAGAEAGTLTLMAGGSREAFDTAEPILKGVGKKVVHCGEEGAGQATKICNNMILGISMIGVSEAFVLAEKLGLSHQALFDVASTSSGQCWSLTSYCPVPNMVESSPANNEYKPGFAAALMLKDLKLSQQAAATTGTATALGAHACDIYEKFAKEGHAGADFSGVINFVRALSERA